ncbi:dihydrofolate reductase-like domain-containing protein [Zopfochytrium polystomum]|nr:dihydrofolate reductase-like domain-containing protein [Zopfochytrium polystomum]
MGRRTWESIPPKFRPLRDRVNYVVTSNPAALHPLPSTVIAVPSLPSALAHAAATLPTTSTLFIIGGAQLYASALALHRRRDDCESASPPPPTYVFLTEVAAPPALESRCDVHFPEVSERAGFRRCGGGAFARMAGDEAMRVVWEACRGGGLAAGGAGAALEEGGAAAAVPEAGEEDVRWCAEQDGLSYEFQLWVREG